MTEADWNRPDKRCLGVRYAAMAEMDVETYTRRLDPHSFLLLLNAGDEPIDFVLPGVPFDRRWRWILDSTTGDGVPLGRFEAKTSFRLEAHSLALFEGEI